LDLVFLNLSNVGQGEIVEQLLVEVFYLKLLLLVASLKHVLLIGVRARGIRGRLL